MKKFWGKSVLACAVMLTLFATWSKLHAGQLTVSNPGFEDNPGNYTSLTGWTTLNFVGYPVGGSSPPFLNGQLTGANIGYESALASGVGTGSQVIQGYSIQADTTYTLGVLVGGRVDSSGYGFGGAVIELYDAITNQVLASFELNRVNGVSPVNGFFALQQASFTTGQNDASIGDSLGIRLEGLGQGNEQTWFDNVSVNATSNPSYAVPEPSTFAMMGLGGIGLAIGAYRRRTHSV